MSDADLNRARQTGVACFDLSSRLAVIEIGGEDAARFLQAQLSCDVARLGGKAGCYGAYLSPQGRVLATMYVVSTDRGLYLLMHPSLIEPAIARLSRYVLRDHVSLRAAPELWVSGRGHAGHDSGAPDLSLLEVVKDATGRALRLPDNRQIRISPHRFTKLPTPDWWRADLEQGIAGVEAATSDRHIAQALGLDRIGAVSFDKGCFPGQEIVARVHYLGRAKRGLHLLRSPATLLPGRELVDAAGKRMGEVVTSAAADEGFLALAVLTRGADTLKTAEGAELTLIRAF